MPSVRLIRKFSGFTFVETIVAVAIMTIVIISVVQIITNTMRFLYTTDIRLSAMTLAREGIESVKNIRDTFVDGNTSTYFSGYDRFALTYPNTANDFYKISFDDTNNITLDRVSEYKNQDQALNHFGEVWGGESGTKLLIHSDTSDGSTAFADASISAHPLTLNGDVKHSTDQQRFGSSSIVFDGAGDYLSVPDSTNWDFGSEDFTIDWWEYRRSSSQGESPIAREGGVDSTHGMVLGRDSGSGNLQVIMSNAAADWAVASPTDNRTLGPITLNVWIHYALVRSGDTFYTFRNGIQQDTWTSTLVVMDGYDDPFLIGRYTDTAYFDGYLDEIRVTKGLARWTSDFTPPDSAYLTEQSADSSVKFWRWLTVEDGLDFFLREIVHQDSDSSSSLDAGETVDLIFTRDVRTSDLSTGNATTSSVISDEYQNTFSISVAGPQPGDTIWMGAEQMRVLLTLQGGLELYVERAYRGTPASSYPSGTPFTYHNLDTLFPSGIAGLDRSWGQGATIACTGSTCTITAGVGADFIFTDRINPYKIFADADGSLDMTGGKGPSFGAVWEDPESPGSFSKILGFSNIRSFTTTVCWEDQFGDCSENQIVLKRDLSDTETGFE